MTKTKLKGLNKNTPFAEAAFIILRHKYYQVLSKIKLFLDDESPENLHDLRISIRRLRYSLENFEICYPKKIFQRVLECLRFLQDLIGETRDLDILKEKVKLFAADNDIEIPDTFYINIDIKKAHATHHIKLELMKFMQDKKMKEFFTKKPER